MKRFIIIILLFLFASCNVYAVTDKQKADIKANRHIYHAKRKYLSRQLDKARADYALLLNDENLDIDIKNKKISEIEDKIYKINEEKIELKRKYEKDKKKIKDNSLWQISII